MSGSEEKWITYVSSEKVKTYVFKFKDDLVGFFELIYHPEKNETEIAYFGILEEYQNKKLGSYLLSEAIKKSFENKVNRVWVHTCSLDHKNALSNYISRGMKIFKTEIAYFGILEEYQNKKLGSYLLSEAIKKSFENKVNRVWVHTCSLDHKNALSNYLSRGMKIFKKESVMI